MKQATLFSIEFRVSPYSDDHSELIAAATLKDAIAMLGPIYNGQRVVQNFESRLEIRRVDATTKIWVAK